MSRAHWLAFGSAMVGIGCNGALGSSGGSAVGPTPDGSTAMTAPTSSKEDASRGDDASTEDDASTASDDASVAEAETEAEASSWGPPDASCPRSGPFTCGSSTCDRATQFCGGVDGVESCQPLSAMSQMADVLDSGACTSCPTCACVLPTYQQESCTCFEDNFGGLTITCSHSSCYGSPPARLDRAPLRAVA
ncbi:MAG TPA: hypothetical protein VF765_37220 [Polyangiaceae bacterium]